MQTARAIMQIHKPFASPPMPNQNAPSRSAGSGAKLLRLPSLEPLFVAVCSETGSSFSDLASVCCAPFSEILPAPSANPQSAEALLQEWSASNLQGAPFSIFVHNRRAVLAAWLPHCPAPMPGTGAKTRQAGSAPQMNGPANAGQLIADADALRIAAGAGQNAPWALPLFYGRPEDFDPCPCGAAPDPGELFKAIAMLASDFVFEGKNPQHAAGIRKGSCRAYPENAQAALSFMEAADLRRKTFAACPPQSAPVRPSGL